MIPKRPYTYIRDHEYEDFGLLGEHALHMRAWIDAAEPGYKEPVRIYHVFIQLPTPHGPNVEIDVTAQARADLDRLRMFEDEIRNSYLEARERELESAV